MVIPSETMD